METNKALKNSYTESKNLISEARREGNLVLFVGAGASINAGMPTWSKAVKQIAMRLGMDEEPLDFLKIPQYYFNARGKKEYTQLMREIFRYKDYLPKQEVHEKIIEFNTSTIITTNYDCLIEKAAEDNGEVIHVVSKDTDFPYRKSGKELIKIHGDFDNDNFVLKEDDYLSYSQNFKLIENYVKSIIGNNVIIFIGYSFNDPDIKQIFSWTKNILKGDFQRAYLIEAEKEYDLNEAEYYKNFGINILYASVQLEANFQKKDINKNLVSMLTWLLQDKILSKLDELYDNLKPFISMNYAREKYINNAFFKAGFKVSNGVISEFHDGTDSDENSRIIRAIAYERSLQDSFSCYIRLEKNNKKEFRINKKYSAKISEHEKITTIIYIYLNL